MENKSSDLGLQEAEIPDSDEEGKIGTLQYSHGEWEPVTCNNVGAEGHTGLLKREEEGGPQYIDYDQVLDEDDWTRNITFTAKKKKCGDTPNDDSLLRNAKAVNPSVNETKKFQKLGALCNIKTKKPKKKKPSIRRKFLSQIMGDKPVCPFFLEGNCAKGYDCQFHHPSRRLMAKGFNKYFITAQRKREWSLPIQQIPCKFFHKGLVCFYEGNCKFSHQPLTDETRILLNKGDCQFVHPLKHSKKDLCKYYLNGQCDKGEDCYFMHQEFPCKFFHTGTICFSKENCRFSHKPLTDETRILLDKHLMSFHSRKVEKKCYREQFKPEKPESMVKREFLQDASPKHVREGAETKQWQGEMKELQQQSESRSTSETHSPVTEAMSPSKFSRPNFYVDTLESTPSPTKWSPLGEISDSVSLPKRYSLPKQPSFTALIEQNDKCHTGVYGTVNCASPPEKGVWQSLP